MKREQILLVEDHPVNRAVIIKILSDSYEVVEAENGRAALDSEQFEVYLQPKYDLARKCVYGAEALARWNHPARGLISPGQFIPIFEKNGFIAKLDFYMWERTCRLLRKWSDAGLNPDPVSVNISPSICITPISWKFCGRWWANTVSSPPF